MNIQLNGKQATVVDNTSIGDLIRAKDLDPAAVVVEHNRAIVATTDWDQVILKENDALEVLRFVGGG
jgi:sulfur carrier protein